MSWSAIKEHALREYVKYGGAYHEALALFSDISDEEVPNVFAEALVVGSTTMTGEAAMELILREADAAGAEMGSAGKDPEIREVLIDGLEGRPVAIATFIVTSRQHIAEQVGT